MINITAGEVFSSDAQEPPLGTIIRDNVGRHYEHIESPNPYRQWQLCGGKWNHSWSSLICAPFAATLVRWGNDKDESNKQYITANQELMYAKQKEFSPAHNRKIIEALIQRGRESMSRQT